jgi:hypothetical protein
MPLGVPTVWREPTNHLNDCYFCRTNTEGFSKKQKHKIQNPNMPSALKPVPQEEGLSVPNPSLHWDGINVYDDDDDDKQVAESPPRSPDAIYSLETSNEPHLIKQNKLNDLVRDLGLSKHQAEILVSRLQEWNLLAKRTRVSAFRKRNETFSAFYRMQDSLCVCADINGLMNQLGIEHSPQEWRLFIQSESSFTAQWQ